MVLGTYFAIQELIADIKADFNGPSLNRTDFEQISALFNQGLNRKGLHGYKIQKLLFLYALILLLVSLQTSPTALRDKKINENINDFTCTENVTQVQKCY